MEFFATVWQNLLYAFVILFFFLKFNKKSIATALHTPLLFLCRLADKLPHDD